MSKYILTLDQSTSGSKVLLIDESGDIVIKKSKPHQQYYPQPGWVEHDPREIYNNIIFLIENVLSESNIDLNQIESLAITNQRETIMAWDKNTGEPVYNAIVWQCNRTAEACDKLASPLINKKIKEKTGLLLNPYFSATKIKWILDNVNVAREKMEDNNLLMGTIDSWLIWNFTSGSVHLTDYTNASRTLLFNIKELSWDEELLDIFGLNKDILPDVKPPDEVFAYTNLNNLLPGEIPIVGVIGDSQGALFGQKCFQPGMAKATYGTGTSVLLNIGKKPVFKEKLVTSIAWGLNGRVDYAFEGIIRSSGDTLKWVKDNLGLFQDFQEVEPLIREIADNEGVYLVPAFSGMGVPYWDMTARAAIIGMTKKTDRRHIIRAAVESIAYQITDAINLMLEESGVSLRVLRADGGATSNQFLMEFQAGLLNKEVAVSEIAELSALGAAYISGLSIGIWKSIDDIKNLNNNSKTYQAKMDKTLRSKYYHGWQTAVKRTLNK
ncbi:glycerol kinase GlpK [Halocella sp. SP3-1]|uniref:glycerol kinase GlpK n=1 Tax=Halocella sp. SP3-1 TaxID=2382161 RepID=UPI000F75DBE0|nr:glycerol kinase GlpK [Halocella sp. SP3-1]AZO95821.1 glycerol kinase [Halocella sp. SP3-1]